MKCTALLLTMSLLVFGSNLNAEDLPSAKKAKKNAKHDQELQIPQLQTELSLTPAQVEAIRPILAAQTAALKKVHANKKLSTLDAANQIAAAYDEAEAKIRAQLTPEQLKIYASKEKPGKKKKKKKEAAPLAPL